jgi:hypothetical protein
MKKWQQIFFNFYLASKSNFTNRTRFWIFSIGSGDVVLLQIEQILHLALPSAKTSLSLTSLQSQPQALGFQLVLLDDVDALHFVLHVAAQISTSLFFGLVLNEGLVFVAQSEASLAHVQLVHRRDVIIDLTPQGSQKLKQKFYVVDFAVIKFGLDMFY